MSKPFKTNSQQLKILRSRNLITCQNCDKVNLNKRINCDLCKKNKNNSRALRILENENYYSLINGYNDLFLYPKNNPDDEDLYRNGSTIYEIYSLYLLDKKLRALLLQELLKYEHYLKTKCAYYFCEENKEAHSYLNYNNYVGESKNIINTINYITKTLSEKNKKKWPINHYIEKYESIPLWVIINHFTFGNIRYFFEICSDSVKIKIADSFNKQFIRGNKKYKNKINIDVRVIELMNIIANFYRNASAHNERVYNLSSKEFNGKFKQKKFKDNYKLPKDHLLELSEALGIDENAIKSGGIFSMIVYLKLFIDKNEYIIFLDKLEDEINKTLENIKTVSRENLLQKMGFGNHIFDWKEKLRV